MEKVTAIIPAAGLGKRFSSSRRKPFAEIAGTPVLIFTLKRLHEIKSIAEIIPVLREEDMEKGLELIEANNFKKIKQLAPGGRERQDSVYNALKLIKKESLVLIHDGVRPLISAELIERLLSEVKGFDGVVPGLPVKETLKKVNAKGFITSTMKREEIWSIQTPQVFPLKTIKEAYDKAYEDGFYATDDAALVERIGGKVKTIEGSPFNIKITIPEDIKIVEFLLRNVREPLAHKEV